VEEKIKETEKLIADTENEKNVKVRLATRPLEEAETVIMQQL
jgi:hypothetical protein